ncbi:MAG: nucleotidyltransferase family protein [Actinomycetota bacterium]|nr:nucleotidyltransferase family protein [Actinomycetota bacterium]
MSGVSAILLAAGSGSRFGGGKLLAPFRGRPLIEAALSELRESPVDEIIVVVGAEGEKLRRICSSYRVRLVENPDWAEGISTSVRTGLRACRPEARAAVVALADQPLVGAAAVERLVGALEEGAEIAVATYGGRPRNPVLFTRVAWPLLERELSGDEGARVVLKRHPELVTEVPCDDIADPADVDTVEDLRRLEEISAPLRGRALGERRNR